MDKIDLRKQFAPLYKTGTKAKEPTLVEVPPMNFLMVDGQGDPNTSPQFKEAIETLYGLSYTLKFGSKMRKGIDWTVMALECLWWADDPAAFHTGDKARWKWTLMIMQPDVVTPAAVEEAREELRGRRRPAAIDRARLERFDEGLAAQVLHVGPYSEEGPTIERLHAFVEQQGYELAGKHHEIYMSDPRRAKPETWKTILRYAVRKAGRK